MSNEEIGDIGAITFEFPFTLHVDLTKWQFLQASEGILEDYVMSEFKRIVNDPDTSWGLQKQVIREWYRTTGQDIRKSILSEIRDSKRGMKDGS